MLGFMIGLLCGGAEYWLLTLLVDGIAKGRIPVWVIPVKMAVLALFFVPCAILLRNQLLVAGITAAVVLIALSAVRFAVTSKKQDAKASGVKSVEKEPL